MHGAEHTDTVFDGGNQMH